MSRPSTSASSVEPSVAAHARDDRDDGAPCGSTLPAERVDGPAERDVAEAVLPSSAGGTRANATGAAARATAQATSVLAKAHGPQRRLEPAAQQSASAESARQISTRRPSASCPSRSVRNARRRG